MQEIPASDSRQVASQLSFDLLDTGTSHSSTGLAFSFDGRRLAGVCDDLLRVWSIPEGEVIASVHTGGHGLAWMPDGQLAVGNWRGKKHGAGEYWVSVLEIPSGRVVQRFGDQEHPINAVAVSPDGSLIVGADYQKAHLWDAKTGSPSAQIRMHWRVVLNLLFSPDGTLLLSRSFGDAAIWTLSGKLVADLGSQGVDGTGGLAVSRSGIIANSANDAVFLFDLQGKLLNKIQTPDYVWSLAFDSKESCLAVGFSEGAIRLYSLNTLECVGELPTRTGVQKMAWNPDGSLAASQDGDIQVWSSRAIGSEPRPKAEARTDDGELDRRLAQVQQKVSGRNLQMNKPAKLDEVQAFEGRHGILLPDGYRRFLLEIGNGGEGPSGALLGLEQMKADAAPCNPREPFPLTEASVWEDDLDDERAESGWLCLINQGCGMFWILIVNGHARGQVWQTGEYGFMPCDPRRDFLSWFEYWLDGGHWNADA